MLIKQFRKAHKLSYGFRPFEALRRCCEPSDGFGGHEPFLLELVQSPILQVSPPHSAAQSTQPSGGYFHGVQFLQLHLRFFFGLNQGSDHGRIMSARCSSLLQKLEEVVIKDEQLIKESRDGISSSLLSGSLSMALCYIQRVFGSGPLHPEPRILCLQGSTDGPEQYVAIMNSIFSAQRSMVPIDSCYMGSSNSAFLKQVFLPYEDNRRGLHLFCMLVYILKPELIPY